MSQRNITFAHQAWADFNSWNDSDPDVAFKIRDLIKEISRDPFSGIGKPEALKGNFRGWWSRRITKEHRLVYRVDNDSITIASCKGHYES